MSYQSIYQDKNSSPLISNQFNINENDNSPDLRRNLTEKRTGDGANLMYGTNQSFSPTPPRTDPRTDPRRSIDTFSNKSSDNSVTPSDIERY